MHRRFLFFVFVLASSALLIGCGKPWQVVHQANPNPLVNQKRFAVMPIDYSGLTIGEKPEATYLAEKDEDQRQSFAGDKDALNGEFARALMDEAGDEGIIVVPATGPGSAPFHIRPHVSFIEPGFYAVVASRPSEVRMSIQIITPDGRLIDEIRLKHGTDSKSSGISIGGISTNPSSGGRLREDGEGLGKIVARYLIERTSGE